MLMELCADKTTVQADRLTEKYIGKWIKVFAKISNVADHGMQLYVSADVIIKYRGGTTKATLWLSFHRDRDRLEIMQRGDNLHAIGQIEKIKPHSMDIRNCELTDR